MRGGVFEKNANDLSDILCYTHDEAQRAERGAGGGMGVLPLFPFCFRFVQAFTCYACCNAMRLFAINGAYALSLCNLSRISASILFESVIF